MAFQKIGVIAGAFDPIHNGHLNFIKDSIKKYDLRKVLVLVEKKSKYKKSFAAYKHREKIAELSIKDMPAVELYESSSDSFPLSSTLPKIKKEYKAKLYLLIGDDVREHISSWPDSENVFEDVELVVAERNNSDKYRQISSGKVREQIKTGLSEADMQKDALIYCRQNKLYG